MTDRADLPSDKDAATEGGYVVLPRRIAVYTAIGMVLAVRDASADALHLRSGAGAANPRLGASHHAHRGPRRAGPHGHQRDQGRRPGRAPVARRPPSVVVSFSLDDAIRFLLLSIHAARSSARETPRPQGAPFLRAKGGHSLRFPDGYVQPPTQARYPRAFFFADRLDVRIASALGPTKSQNEGELRDGGHDERKLTARQESQAIVKRELARNLNRLMAEKNMSQADLARAATRGTGGTLVVTKDVISKALREDQLPGSTRSRRWRRSSA